MLALQPAACLTMRVRAGAQVECLSGAVWVTCSGDERDVFLAAGESAATRGGIVVIEALETARVRVVTPARHAWLCTLREQLNARWA